MTDSATPTTTESPASNKDYLIKSGVIVAMIIALTYAAGNSPDAQNITARLFASIAAVSMFAILYPFPPFKKRKFALITFIVACIFLGATMDKKATNQNSSSVSVAAPTQQAVEEPAPQEAAIMQTTAKELAVAYEKNTVSADAKFKHKDYVVTGIVTEITTDMMDNAVLSLDGGTNEFLQPQFILEDGEKEKAGQIEKGQEVTLRCTGAGDMVKMPRSENCVFQ